MAKKQLKLEIQRLKLAARTISLLQYFWQSPGPRPRINSIVATPLQPLIMANINKHQRGTPQLHCQLAAASHK